MELEKELSKIVGIVSELKANVVTSTEKDIINL